jgi:4-hydroxythreonine-4-phosphate dehydrogenase
MSGKGDKPKAKPVGITLGDPVGVGPEVLVKAFAEAGVEEWDQDFLIIGSEEPIKQAERVVGVKLALKKVGQPDEWPEKGLPQVALLEPPESKYPEGLAPGKPGAASGLLSFQYLEAGTQLALDGRLKALVTLPVSKSLIARNVPDFRGHTEYLQEKAGVENVRMMLGTNDFLITLVTTHSPMSEVPSRLTAAGISETIVMTHKALKARTGAAPLIVVCALNPHAGDAGLLGSEENDVITPGIIDASNRGCRCVGPYPADVALSMTADGDYDAAVAMYHDQALIALKLTRPNQGANMTLGLPFVRTSPLHGTGFDIAGKGIAAEESFIDALRSAVSLAQNAPYTGGP